MKRNVLCVAIICMTLMFAGCSSVGNQENGAEKSNEGVIDEADTKSEDDTEKEIDQLSLNVENDTFSFDTLIQQIGVSEESVLTILGAEEKNDSYETELFGEKVVIVLSTEGENVSAIELAFESTDAKLLTNAIAEQLGSDGEAGDRTVTWEQENCTVVLQEMDQGCEVEISGHNK